jgi:hypothetical protein
MKKRLKKLMLAKETLREMTPQELRDAAGGTECTYFGCGFWQKLGLGTSFYCSRD